MRDADQHIQDCIARRQSFVLDAGAGAGKTYSLVLALQHARGILAGTFSRTGQRTACITYTNAAKDEIIARIGDSPLVRVSTIHDFLWAVLKGHQKALKRAVLKVNDALKNESSRKKDSAELVSALELVAVTYSDRGSNFLEGRLFHDDLIEVAAEMFLSNPLLGNIVAAQFPYILVDEYQDASPKVIAILLSVIERSPGRAVVGLFGDRFQNIYDTGVGELPEHAARLLEPVIKGDNRRCSLAVIALLNNLRTDIKQFPAGDNVLGQAVYIHVNRPDEHSIARIREFTASKLGWSSDDGTEKELHLTHKLIARKGGYGALLDTYAKRGDFFRDRLLSGEDRRMLFFLDRVEPVALAWKEGNTGRTLTLLRHCGFELPNNKSKLVVVAALNELIGLREKATIRVVLTHLREAKLAILPDDFRDRLAGTEPPAPDSPEEAERQAKDRDFYTSLLSLPYSEVVAFTDFFREHTPFSTKHGVKGTEFDTVYVVLDDRGARWTKYSFEKYLSLADKSENPERFRKTGNLFYVCSSRAKKRLAVIDLGPKSGAKTGRVQALFGADNCFDI